MPTPAKNGHSDMLLGYANAQNALFKICTLVRYSRAHECKALGRTVQLNTCNILYRVTISTNLTEFRLVHVQYATDLVQIACLQTVTFCKGKHKGLNDPQCTQRVNVMCAPDQDCCIAVASLAPQKQCARVRLFFFFFFLRSAASALGSFWNSWHANVVHSGFSACPSAK